MNQCKICGAKLKEETEDKIVFECGTVYDKIKKETIRTVRCTNNQICDAILIGYKTEDKRIRYLSSYNLTEDALLAFIKHLDFEVATFETEMLNWYKNIGIIKYMDREVIFIWSDIAGREAQEEQINEYRTYILEELEKFVDESEKNLKMISIDGDQTRLPEEKLR